MSHRSYWSDTASLPRYASPDQDISVDVAVIGGGITGITTAYLLKKAGATVALLERQRCVAVDTAATTAHVTAVTDMRLHEIARHFGRESAQAVWEAGTAAIDQIVALIRAEDISCDFRWVSGWLHSPPGGKRDERTMFDQEAGLARECGIEAERTNELPFFATPGIRFPHQAIFHPKKYLAGLLPRIPGQGSHVFENSDAAEVEEKPRAVKVGTHRIRCHWIVMATHNPLTGLAGSWGSGLFQSKLALYTSYAISGRLPSDFIPEGCYWDTGEPYNYLRVEKRRGFDYAIYGGEDHKTGQETDPEARYEALAKRLFGLAPKFELSHRWSGQVIETSDGLPYIGILTEHQFGATGFSGNGMTFGTLGAMMAVDAVLGRRNPWATLFDPGRKAHHGGMWTYLKENWDYPYYMLRDRLARADTGSLRNLRKGEGKILSLDGKKVAAFRDDAGKVTTCSPVCTHLKCIVAWNAEEKTWDCPCHGSRFKPTGEVISGPAEEPLERLAP